MSKKHRKDCRCPCCDEEMAAIVDMTPEQYAAWLTLKQRDVQRFHASRRGNLTAASDGGEKVMRTVGADDVADNVSDDGPMTEAEAIEQLRAAGVLPPEEEMEDFLQELERMGPMPNSGAVASTQLQLAKTNTRRRRAAKGGDRHDRRKVWISEISKCAAMMDHFTDDDLTLLSDATLRRLSEISARHRAAVVSASKATGGGEVREPALPSWTLAAAKSEVKAAKGDGDGEQVTWKTAKQRGQGRPIPDPYAR